MSTTVNPSLLRAPISEVFRSLDKGYLPPARKVFLGTSSVEGAGMGVFALEEFTAGDLIEVARVTLIPKLSKEDWAVEGSLNRYAIDWERAGLPGVEAALPLGFQSVVNDSTEPNCLRIDFFKEQVAALVAIEDIMVCQELFIDYYPGVDESPRVSEWSPS